MPRAVNQDDDDGSVLLDSHMDAEGGERAVVVASSYSTRSIVESSIDPMQYGDSNSRLLSSSSIDLDDNAEAIFDHSTIQSSTSSLLQTSIKKGRQILG